ncbi:MAG TPA: hypothetical protein VK184_14190 [Nostocaceae cyanobacterium]|nr:hypothetical protein [Nostocaceae cyanobacterium]
MDLTRLEYIKNINDSSDWAYKHYLVGSYFPLNFKKNEDSDSERVDNHALKLPKGSLIILSQRPPEHERYLTHVVELVNEGSEDKPQWDTGEWGIIRWVKVHWVADFNDISRIPLDREVMKTDWGWRNTTAKSLNGENLIKQWGSIDNLKTHLATVFN